MNEIFLIWNDYSQLPTNVVAPTFAINNNKINSFFLGLGLTVPLDMRCLKQSNLVKPNPNLVGFSKRVKSKFG